MKVTSAQVELGAVEGQIPGPSASGSKDDRTAQVSDAHQPTTEAPVAAGPVPPLSSTAARRAALSYLAGLTSTNVTWSARGFQPVRGTKGAEFELPATLIVEKVRDTLQYRGGFYFSHDPGAGGWMLTRLSFRHPEPIPSRKTSRPPWPRIEGRRHGLAHSPPRGAGTRRDDNPAHSSGSRGSLGDSDSRSSSTCSASRHSPRRACSRNVAFQTSASIAVNWGSFGWSSSARSRTRDA